MARAAKKNKKRGRSKPHRGRTFFLLLLLGVAIYLLLRPSMGELQRERERLRALLDGFAAKDSSLRGAPHSDVVLGLRWVFAQELTEQIASRALDRAALHLSGIRVVKSGEVGKKLLLSRVRVGRWNLRLDVSQIRGVLRTGRPRIEYGDERRVSVLMPVTLQEGGAWGTLSFDWNARAVTSLVCRDFAVREEVEASILPQPHELKGELMLTTDGETVVVSPRIHGRPLRVRAQPSRRSWGRAEAALRAQDTFWKCGLALRPEDVLAQLREIVAQGMDVRLPTLEPGEIRVPIAFRRHVRTGEGRVEMRLHADSLDVTLNAIWYGASVDSRKIAGCDGCSPSPAALLQDANSAERLNAR